MNLKKVEAEEETRMDGEEGPFTKAEFFDVYGGYDEWDAADPKAYGRRFSQTVQLKKVEEETRMDGDEGPFTKAEFFDVYGGYDEWNAAAPDGPAPPVPKAAPPATSAPPPPPAPAAAPAGEEETRMDGEEGPFTKAEFFGVYGGYDEWDAAETRMDGEEGPFTKAEFFEVGRVAALRSHT